MPRQYFRVRKTSRLSQQPTLLSVLWRTLITLLLLGMPLLAFMPDRAATAQSGITSPSDGSAVNGAVTVMGTAVIDPFQKYELHYKQEPSGDDAFIYFDGGTVQVTGGQLGIWQAAGLPPGTYTLRLRVVKNDGNYAEYYTRNLSVNQGAVAPAAPETAEDEDENGDGPDSSDTETTSASNEPTPTPIPTATFTPAPQPTPVVGAVAQPELNIAPTPTPTPEEIAIAIAPGGTGDSLAVLADPNVTTAQSGGSVTRELGEALSINRLRTSFFNGVRFSAALFFGVVAIYAGKRLFDWAWSQFS